LPIHSGSPDESGILVRTAARNPHERHVLRLGADLQYIRLTGSIVGGVAGVALHAVLVVAHFG
jgi:uncharacterized membrane-anchored protein YjiN (DUF445 family)